MDYVDSSRPDRLMEVNVTVIDNTECNEAYANEAITNSMICARDEGKDSCQGDSGGKVILYYLYYSPLHRSHDNHGGWWFLLTDRCGVLGLWLCKPSLPRGVCQGYTGSALD